MRITRGRHKGKTGRLVQFANNWIGVDVDGRQEIVSPRHVALDDDTEFDAFDGTNPTVGTFFQQWQLTEDGTFRRHAQTKENRP